MTIDLTAVQTDEFARRINYFACSKEVFCGA